MSDRVPKFCASWVAWAKGDVLSEGGEQALGFAYCSLSKVAIAVASAHHGGGSLVWDGRGWQGLAGQRGAP